MNKYEQRIISTLNRLKGSCMKQSLMIDFNEAFTREVDLTIKLDDAIQNLIDSNQIQCINPDTGHYKIVP
jgi:hypothetical protein